MRPIIKSRKHYIQITRSQISTVSTQNELLIESVGVTAKNTPREVEEGAIVKAIYIEMWLLDSANDGSNVVVLSKQNESGLGPSNTEILALDTWNNKKNILFTHQGLSSNNGVGNPMAVMRGWYKVPKSKQRFGLGDILSLTIRNSGPNVLEFCGFATFKEYT